MCGNPATANGLSHAHADGSSLYAAGQFGNRSMSSSVTLTSLGAGAFTTTSDVFSTVCPISSTKILPDFL